MTVYTHLCFIHGKVCIMADIKTAKTGKTAVAVLLIIAILISCVMSAAARNTATDSGRTLIIQYGKSVKPDYFGTEADDATYVTSSKRIACVSKDGTIRSMGRGTCTVSALNNETGETVFYTVKVKVVWWRVITNLIYFIRNLHCPVCREGGGEGELSTTSPSETETGTTSPPPETSEKDPDTTGTTQPENKIFNIPPTVEEANRTLDGSDFSADPLLEYDNLTGYLVMLPVSSLPDIVSFTYNGKKYTPDDLTVEEQLDSDLFSYKTEDCGQEFMFIRQRTTDKDHGENEYWQLLVIALYDADGNLSDKGVTAIEYKAEAVTQPTTETTTEDITDDTSDTTEDITDDTDDTSDTTEDITDDTGDTSGDTSAPTIPTTSPGPAVENAKDSFGGTGTEVVTGAAGTSGNFYVCGRSSSRDGEFASLLPSSGYAMPFGFLKRYDSSGNLLWTKVITANASVYVTDVCAQRNGNAVICGYEFIDRNTSTKYTPFIAVYDTNGNQLLKEVFTASENDLFYCIAATSNGFAVGGRVSSTDGAFADSTRQEAACAYLARYALSYDDSGSCSLIFKWNRYLSGDKYATITDIAADNLNRVFVSCQTSATQYDFAEFDGLVENSIDNIIIRYSDAGSFSWYCTLSTKGTDNFCALTADGNGGCAAAGNYTYNGATSGSVGGTLNSIYFMGGVDSSVIKIDSSGSITWTKTLSGSKDDYITCIARCGNIYSVGGYTDSSDMSFSVNKGRDDAFLTVLSSSGSVIRNYYLAGSSRDGLNALAYTSEYLIAAGSSASKDLYFEGMNENAVDSDSESEISYDGFAVVYHMES